VYNSFHQVVAATDVPAVAVVIVAVPRPRLVLSLFTAVCNSVMIAAVIVVPTITVVAHDVTLAVQAVAIDYPFIIFIKDNLNEPRNLYVSQS
jgi:hypothetical protein